MNIEQIAKASPLVLGWLTAAVGWVTALRQWRKKRKSEAELKLIRRRGEAPYLVPSQSLFNHLYFDAGGGEIRFFPGGSGNVLCSLRDEVAKETAPGTPIFFVVENNGKGARRVTITLDGQAARLRHEPQIQGAHDLSYLEYSYNPAKHGQNQCLVIEFETETGVQDRHTYLLKHGFRSLTRQHPP